MEATVPAILVGLVFVILLLAGRLEIVKGANPQVANGAVLMVLATLVGMLALGALLSSLDL